MKYLLCIFFIFISSSSLSEISKCIVNGKTIYTDEPCPDGTQQGLNLKINKAPTATDSYVDRAKVMAIAQQVALKFDYYDEISDAFPNAYEGIFEVGGQCGDYALAFVNKWNELHNSKALLVIQQQGLKNFPDGLYEVIGKDNRELPFLKNRTTSMLYKWNNLLGVGHPELGGYQIKLVKNTYVDSHFGIKNWKSNGPHVWVRINDISVDPTYTDKGTLPTMGYDSFR